MFFLPAQLHSESKLKSLPQVPFPSLRSSLEGGCSPHSCPPAFRGGLHSSNRSEGCKAPELLHRRGTAFRTITRPYSPYDMLRGAAVVLQTRNNTLYLNIKSEIRISLSPPLQTHFYASGNPQSLTQKHSPVAISLPVFAPVIRNDGKAFIAART